jgi:hypothetical protein
MEAEPAGRVKMLSLVMKIAAFPNILLLNAIYTGNSFDRFARSFR